MLPCKTPSHIVQAHFNPGHFFFSLPGSHRYLFPSSLRAPWIPPLPVLVSVQRPQGLGPASECGACAAGQSAELQLGWVLDQYPISSSWTIMSLRWWSHGCKGACGPLSCCCERGRRGMINRKGIPWAWPSRDALCSGHMAMHGKQSLVLLARPSASVMACPVALGTHALSSTAPANAETASVCRPHICACAPTARAR